jgi:hypothetical protein
MLELNKKYLYHFELFKIKYIVLFNTETFSQDLSNKLILIPTCGVIFNSKLNLKNLFIFYFDRFVKTESAAFRFALASIWYLAEQLQTILAKFIARHQKSQV